MPGTLCHSPSCCQPPYQLPPTCHRASLPDQQLPSSVALVTYLHPFRVHGLRSVSCRNVRSAVSRRHPQRHQTLLSAHGESRHSHPAARPQFPWVCSEDGATELGLQVLLDGSCEQTRVEAPGPGTHQMHAHIPGCRISNVVCGFCEKSLPMVHFVQASHFLFYFIFVYFQLCWVFTATQGLSPRGGVRGLLEVRCAGFALRWLLLSQSTGSRGSWAQSLWLPDSRAQAG